MSSSAGILGNVSSLLDELEDRAIDGPNDFELGGFDWATEEVLTSLHDHTEFEASRHTQNGSLDEDWIGQIAELVSDISVWEEKAENLTAIANEAYERLKGSSSVAAHSAADRRRRTSDTVVAPLPSPGGTSVVHLRGSYSILNFEPLLNHSLTLSWDAV